MSKPSLKNHWYAVGYSSHITKTKPFGIRLWGEPLVIFRDKQDNPICLQDRCPHRSAPLSMGSVKDGVLTCCYHGWSFSTDGKCVDIPRASSEFVNSVKAVSYPCVEHQGLVWVWIGDSAKADKKLLPCDPEWNNPKYALQQTAHDMESEWNYNIENVLDPIHVFWLHNGSVPGLTRKTLRKFRCKEVPDNNGIRIRFENPDGTSFLDTTFMPPNRMRMDRVNGTDNEIMVQVFTFIPISKTHTRLLLRQYRTVFKIGNYIPGFSALWEVKNHRVLLEDYRVIAGQNLRVNAGANVLNRPQTEDLPVRKFYKWLEEALKEGSPWFTGWGENKKSCSDCGCGLKENYGNWPELEYPPANKTYFKILQWKIRGAMTLLFTGIALGSYIVYRRFVKK